MRMFLWRSAHNMEPSGILPRHSCSWRRSVAMALFGIIAMLCRTREADLLLVQLASIAPCSGHRSLGGRRWLCGGAAELLDDTPSGIGGCGVGAGRGGACKGCSVAFQREPRKGILSVRVLVCSTRFCNFCVSKASKSCCSVADISQYVLFPESLSAHNRLPWASACLASADSCCFWRRKSGSRVLICRACASPGRWSCSIKLCSRESHQCTPSSRMLCSCSCDGFSFRTGASNSSGRP